MKGLSETLIIVITAVILLVVALVLLTIFAGGVAPVVDIAGQRSICQQTGASVCATTGSLPLDWSVPKAVKSGGVFELKSCADLVTPTTPGGSGCSAYGYPTPSV